MFSYIILIAARMIMLTVVIFRDVCFIANPTFGIGLIEVLQIRIDERAK